MDELKAEINDLKGQVASLQKRFYNELEKKDRFCQIENKHLSQEWTNAIISVRKRAPSSGLPSEVKAYFYV